MSSRKILIAFLYLIIMTCSSEVFSRDLLSCYNLIVSSVLYVKDKTLDIIPNLNQSHYYATKLRYHIMTKNKGVEHLQIPMNKLSMIHPITMENSKEKLLARIQVLKNNKDTILQQGVLSIAHANELIPSKNPIRVVAYEDGTYIVFDGNGRYEAIKQAFAGSNVLIEVEHYILPNNQDYYEIIKKILEIRFPR